MSNTPLLDAMAAKAPSTQYEVFKTLGEDVDLLKITPRQKEFLKAALRTLLKIQLEREFGLTVDI